MPEASPVKWHLAHTTWFFEVMVLRQACAEEAWFDEAFNFLFNSYYNTVGEQYSRPHRGLITRPTVVEVERYRDHVDRRMLQFMSEASDEAWARWAEVIELGLHHEQQHQELLVTDLKHALAQNPLFPVYRQAPERPAGEAPELSWQRFPKGLHEQGHDGTGFSFDNEGPRHEALIHAFELASRPVSCGEYLAFMADGGYERPELWLSEGWSTVQAQGWRAPLYWQERESDWWQFTLAGLCRVDPAEPVCHVSLFEADAYARWAEARLPTEFEWELAAAQRSIEGHFAEELDFHPRPATGEPGLQQLFGTVWEWTSSSYAPYPGYRPLAGALGEYNGKFMCNQYVLRGGSCATPRSHIRATYRNFFPAQARWQLEGIRLARDV